VPEGRNIELISSLKSLKEDHWDDLARIRKRLIIATLLIADAFVGLLYHTSSLNLLDYILADNLPFEMVFLLQSVQAISCGFFYVKILFDDAKSGILRSLGMFGSPFFLLAVIFITLEFLFTGQGLATDINIDSIAIVRETLTHSSTFLSIALGLTLTYKVQRYGNFAQSEFFMIGMFTTFVISWTGVYSPIFDSPRDDVIVWTLLFRVIVAAFIITGIAGVMVDLLVYRGFRLRDATPQVMMIGSLGVALALRAIFYLRFTSDKRQWFPDMDFSDQYTQKWIFPTTKLRIWLGDRSLAGSEDANGNGVFDVETYTQAHANAGEIPMGAAIGDIISGTGEDLDGDGRLDVAQRYTHNNCEQSTNPETGELMFDEVTGDPILERIVTEGWSLGNPGSGGSRPAFELYDVGVDCVSQATNYYSYLKGSVAATIFTASILLYLFLTKSRLGMQMRAVADNPELAASSGINVERVQTISAFLSAGISGIGGSVFAMTYLWNPVSAFTLLLPAFAIIVLGTIGSIPGAIVASIIVGFTKAISAVVLMGIGPDLHDRYSYFALADVMPYTFLIAILLIMPQGIGHAWEEWKIERMRKTTALDPEDSRNSRAALAFLPTGIFGLHHWWGGRSDKAQNYSLVAIAAYLFHRFSSFIGRESLSDDGCGNVCSESLDDMKEELADLAIIIEPSTEEVGRMDELIISIDDYSKTNLEVLTGREDGTLMVEDSPYFSEAPSTLDESWLDLMQTEIQTVDLIADAGDLIWPLIPLLLWALAIYEGTRILREGKLPSSMSERSRIRGITSPFNEISTLIQILRTPWERGRSLIRTADRRHSETVLSVKAWMTNQVAPAKDLFARESTLSRLPSWLNIPYGRRGKTGSNIAFLVLLLVLLGFLWWLPITDSDTWRWNKVFQVSNVVSLLCVFILMSFSLNLHTGYTGMVNFGVIFFVAIGGVTVAILTAPKSVNGYEWGFPSAIIASTVLAAAIGWGLAYPTARLRTDYFAIVTISLGEILRQLLAVEPLLRTGSAAQGIYSYPKPLYEWWFCGSTNSGPGEEYFSPNDCRTAMLDSPSMAISNLLDLGNPAPYFTLLSIIGLIAVIAVWILLESLISSPWGRVLKAIREDEEVAQHHGHNVLTHKAASLALGAVIASFAGSLWVWKLSGIESPWMAPATSTFLVWAAFVIGGTGNNRGMVIGSFIMVLMHFVFNVLIAASSPDLPLYATANSIDNLFAWIVTEQWEVTRIFFLILLFGIMIRSRTTIEIGACGSILFAFTALVLGERTILEVNNIYGEVSIAGAGMSYVKLLLIGLLMVFSMKFNPRGLLPEVPNRPDRPSGGDSR